MMRPGGIWFVSIASKRRTYWFVTWHPAVASSEVSQGSLSITSTSFFFWFCAPSFDKPLCTRRGVHCEYGEEDHCWGSIDESIRRRRGLSIGEENIFLMHCSFEVFIGELCRNHLGESKLITLHNHPADSGVEFWGRGSSHNRWRVTITDRNYYKSHAAQRVTHLCMLRWWLPTLSWFFVRSYELSYVENILKFIW